MELAGAPTPTHVDGLAAETAQPQIDHGCQDLIVNDAATICVSVRGDSLSRWLQSLALGQFAAPMFELGCEGLGFLQEMELSEAAQMCDDVGMKSLQRQRFLSRLMILSPGLDSGSDREESLGEANAQQMLHMGLPHQSTGTILTGQVATINHASPMIDLSQPMVKCATNTSPQARLLAFDDAGFHTVRPQQYLEAMILPRLQLVLRQITDDKELPHWPAGGLERSAEWRELLLVLAAALEKGAEEEEAAEEAIMRAADGAERDGLRQLPLAPFLLQALLALNRERPTTPAAAVTFVAAHLRTAATATASDLTPMAEIYDK